jgi:hypothetical protein
MEPPSVIDITRREGWFIAWCPECGLERELPHGWQDILRASMPPAEALTWDGVMRCREHGRQEMTLTEFALHPERGGLPVIHLVRDDDRARTACTGAPWQPPPHAFRPHLPRMQCQACYRLVIGR